MFVKHFLEWIGIKQKLHVKNVKPPFVHEGTVWWASLGENIGYEINGKSQNFTRPVIIYKKLSKRFFLVIPATTKQKKGNWYVNYSHKGVNATACLQQIRTIDYRRLDNFIGELNDQDFSRIIQSFNALYYKKLPPTAVDGGRGKIPKALEF